MNRPVLFLGLVTLAFGACGVIVAVTAPSDKPEDYAVTREAALKFVGVDGGVTPFRSHLLGFPDDGGNDTEAAAQTFWCGNDGAAPLPPPAYVPGYGPPASTPVTVTNTYPSNVCVQKIVAGSFWYFSAAVPVACANWTAISCACLADAGFAPCNVGAAGQCTANGQGFPQYLCVGQ